VPISGRWTIETWLKEIVLDKQRMLKENGSCNVGADNFEETNLDEICRFMRKLMKFEPEQRTEAREILDNPWFHG